MATTPLFSFREDSMPATTTGECCYCYDSRPVLVVAYKKGWCCGMCLNRARKRIVDRELACAKTLLRLRRASDAGDAAQGALEAARREGPRHPVVCIPIPSQ